MLQARRSALAVRAEGTQEVAKDEMDVVSRLRAAVLGRVGQERMDLWLRGGEALRLEEGALVVVAADEFTLDRVRRTLRDELLLAAEQALSQRPQVRFQIDDALRRTAAGRGKRRTIDTNQRLFDFGDELPDAAAAPISEGAQPPRENTAPRENHGALPTGRRFARLESFVCSAGSRFAHAAAHKAVSKPGDVSPLYLHGPTGCGKTHLAEGIWSALRRAGKHCVFLAAEQFTTQFLESLRGQGLPSFRRKLRDVDLLVIDDVQFLHGKRATIQELLNTVEHFSRERKQLVLAADRPPADLPSFGPELQARLASGLTADMPALDVTARREILVALSAQRGRRLPDEILDLLSAELPGDGRRLQGALLRLEAMQEATGRSLSVGFTREALKDLLRPANKLVRLIDIDKVVCEVFGLEPKSLRSEAKARSITTPRTLAMYLARKHTGAGLSEISEHFGLRSHSVVVAAQKKVGNWRAQQTQIGITGGQCDVEEALRRVESALRVI
jgi:chromosomal replication initiator protein